MFWVAMFVVDVKESDNTTSTGSRSTIFEWLLSNKNIVRSCRFRAKGNICVSLFCHLFQVCRQQHIREYALWRNTLLHSATSHIRTSLILDIRTEFIFYSPHLTTTCFWIMNVLQFIQANNFVLWHSESISPWNICVWDRRGPRFPAAHVQTLTFAAWLRGAITVVLQATGNKCDSYYGDM